MPPVSRPRARKGSHPSNPYAAEAAAAPRLEDRPGYPFAARKADLSDEAQLGAPPPSPKAVAASPEGEEPTFVLRAADPLFGMMVRFWANANTRTLSRAAFDEVHALAARGDAWRERNSRAG